MEGSSEKSLEEFQNELVGDQILDEILDEIDFRDRLPKWDKMIEEESLKSIKIILGENSNYFESSKLNTSRILPTISDFVCVTFRIQYETNFGQNLCLVGDTEELGNWKEFSKNKMRWTKGHNWEIKV